MDMQLPMVAFNSILTNILTHTYECVFLCLCNCGYEIQIHLLKYPVDNNCNSFTKFLESTDFNTQTYTHAHAWVRCHEHYNQNMRHKRTHTHRYL